MESRPTSDADAPTGRPVPGTPPDPAPGTPPEPASAPAPDASAPGAAPTGRASANTPASGADAAPADGPRRTHGDPQPAGSGAPPDDIAIEFRGVSKAFGKKVILKDASLAIPRGTSAVVMGGSGTGKSVTIKHVVQLLRPDAGEVWVLGQQVESLDPDAMDALRLRVGYLFQSGALFDSMTVYENMDFILSRHTEMSADERQARIMETLSWVDIEAQAKQYPSELSGGQRKRAGLARSIILEPEIMLYDEPTTGLDPISVRTVANLITRLRDERGITSITITHDLLCAEMIADYVYFLVDQTYGVHGPLPEVAASDHPFLQEFFGDEAARLSALDTVGGRPYARAAEAPTA